MSAVPVAPRITGTAWYALALVAFSNAMSLLDRNILAILAPHIKADLHIGDAEMGLLYGTVFALFYALFSLPLGRLSDGWLRNRILSISILFWSLASGLAAFANGFAVLIISRLGVGIGEGATSPAGTSLLFDYFPKQRRGLVMAVIAAAIAVGLGMSNVIGGVAAQWWDTRYAAGGAPMGFRGWQFAFLVASAPGFVLALLLWSLKEPKRGAMDGIDTPRDPAPFKASFALLGSVTPGVNFLSLAARGATGRNWLSSIGFIVATLVAAALLIHWASGFSPRPSLDFGAVQVNPHVIQWGVMAFGAIVIFNLLQGLSLTDKPTYALTVKSPAIMIAMAVGALQTVINYGVMGFTPTFIMTVYGESQAETAVKFGMLSLAIGVLGPVIAGLLADWFDRSIPGTGRVYLTLFALGVSPIVGIWTYYAGDAGSFYTRFVLYSLILTCWIPPLYSLMYGLVLPRMRGITASMYLIISTIFGVGIGPYQVGMVSDATGGDLRTAILSTNWVAVPIVILLLVLATRVRKDEATIVERARAAGEPV